MTETLHVDGANGASRSHTRGHARLSVAAQVGLLAGPFLSMLDANIVNVALPDIATRLHTGLDTAQWILSGYLLALAAGLAASAYLAKRFGTWRVYLVSLLGFTLASALCGLAPTIGILIAMRAVQGAVGAALVPLAMNLLLGGKGAAQQMPPAAGIVLFLAPALGPTIGGLLLHVAGWPLIFFINVPFGLLGALGVLRMRQAAEQAEGAPRASGARFDPVGLVLLASGLVFAIYGATVGPQQGWTSGAAGPSLASGFALLVLYVLWALRRPHPAVDLKLLRHAQTALAVGLSALAAVVLFVMLFLLPIYMEDLQGLSPLVVGLALLPQGLVTGVGTVLGMRLAARWAVRLSAALGMGILTLSTAALLLIGVATPAWVTALILSGRGLALGLVIQPLLNAIMGGLEREEIPDGNTLFNVAQRLGGSIGISLLATFFTLREQIRVDQALGSLGIHVRIAEQSAAGTSLAQLPGVLREQVTQAAIAGFHDTVWLLVLLSAFGACAALRLRDPVRVLAPTAAHAGAGATIRSAE